MSILRTVPVIAACAILAACGSSTSTESSSAPAVAASAVAQPAQAEVPVPLPSSSPTGELSCANFDMSAAHLVTDAHYASLNTGTNNDTQPSFADMNEAMGVLTAMAPKCAPDAVAAIAALGVAAGETVAAYQSGDDPAAITANKAAIEALKVKGVAAWTAMGQDPAAWDTAIVFYG